VLVSGAKSVWAAGGASVDDLWTVFREAESIGAVAAATRRVGRLGWLSQIETPGLLSPTGACAARLLRRGHERMTAVGGAPRPRRARLAH